MKTKILSLFICTLLTTSFLVMVINAEEESYLKEKNISIVFSEPNLQEGEQYLTLKIEEATADLMDPGKPILPIYTKIFKFPFGTKIKEVI